MRERTLRPRSTAGRARVPVAASRLGPADRSRLARAARAGDRLGGRELVRVLERRLRREQAPRPGRESARSTTRAACSSPTPTTILLLGTDNARSSRAAPATCTPTRSCCCAPTRRIIGSTTSRSRATSRSRSRARRRQKINAAFQIGGAGAGDQDDPRSSRAPDINHVIVVNFGDFKDLIDRLGGITVDVPKPIRSNRFDCPYATQARCDRWQGWRFHKGPQHMNGERALIYSRIRENLLDPAETDVTRGARQQAVIDAVSCEVHLDRHAARSSRSTAARSSSR